LYKLAGFRRSRSVEGTVLGLALNPPENLKSQHMTSPAKILDLTLDLTFNLTLCHSKADTQDYFYCAIIPAFWHVGFVKSWAVCKELAQIFGILDLETGGQGRKMAMARAIRRETLKFADDKS
jgi:hypothetical protein